MRYEARITAYDLMDRVQFTVAVYETAGAEEGHYRAVLTSTGSVQGEGISDPAEWARDVLVAALESL